MPTISARVIKKPRKIRFCNGYRHRVLISGPQMRIYGNAFVGDPLYVMYTCLECARESDDTKIMEALERYGR